MLNATKKARRVYVERIDLRTAHNAKTDIFRVSIGDTVLFDGTPDEMRKLVSILKSFPEMYQVESSRFSKGESLEVNRILKKASQQPLKLSEIQFLRDMHARNWRNDYVRRRMNKCSEVLQLEGVEEVKAF